MSFFPTVGRAVDYFKVDLNLWGTLAPPEESRFPTAAGSGIFLDLGADGRWVRTIYFSTARVESGGGFGTTVSGVVPTDPCHLTTKGYVDGAIATALSGYVAPSGATSGVVSADRIYGEEPTGTMNGMNETFQLASGFLPGSLAVFYNGLRISNGEFAAAAPRTLTLGFAPCAGDSLLVDYTKGQQ